MGTRIDPFTLRQTQTAHTPAVGEEAYELPIRTRLADKPTTQRTGIHPARGLTPAQREASPFP